MHDKPNVYADYSSQCFYLYPSKLAQNIRLWLEMDPEKVLFGTDAYSSAKENAVEFNTPLADWEEMLWFCSFTARKALLLALQGMITDKEITEQKARQIAEMVLNGNARKIYHFN